MTAELVPYMVLKNDTVTVYHSNYKFTVPAKKAKFTVELMKLQLFKSVQTMQQNRTPIISL